jgi:hypothetical protein
MEKNNQIKKFLFKVAKMALQSITVALIKDYIKEEVIDGKDPLNLKPVLTEMICQINVKPT